MSAGFNFNRDKVLFILMQQVNLSIAICFFPDPEKWFIKRGTVLGLKLLCCQMLDYSSSVEPIKIIQSDHFSLMSD